jgi:hypothetical protein
MTVAVEQANADNADEAEPIRGEIQTVIDEGETPQGAKVKLKSGVTGYVTRVVAEE